MSLMFETVLANEISTCPYCGHDRWNPATRRYRCKSCKNTVYVKRTVEDRQKRPVTLDQLREIEQQWQQYSDEQYEIQRAEAEAENIKHSLNYLRDLKRDGNSFVSVNIHEPCSSCTHHDGNIFTIAEALKAPLYQNPDCRRRDENTRCLPFYTVVFDDELPEEFK